MRVPTLTPAVLFRHRFGYLRIRVAGVLTAAIFALAGGRANAGLTFTTIHAFSGPDGDTPMGELVQGRDGNLYGVTQYGGPSEAGTVFKISMDGTFTPLASFGNSNGAAPHAGLVLANDGDFYGTTADGGASSKGAIFKVTPEGALSLLASFNGTNGASPGGELVQANDGNFYGTTIDGGIPRDASGLGYGTIFRVTSEGVLSTMFFFNAKTGFEPWAALTKGLDGNLYGTTRSGGGYTTIQAVRSKGRTGPRTGM